MRHFYYKWRSFAVFLRLLPCHFLHAIYFIHIPWWLKIDATLSFCFGAETRVDMKCVIYHFNKCFFIREGWAWDRKEINKNTILHSLMLFRRWHDNKCSFNEAEKSSVDRRLHDNLLFISSLHSALFFWRCHFDELEKGKMGHERRHKRSLCTLSSRNENL